jgi:predicted transcriptional regulator
MRADTDQRDWRIRVPSELRQSVERLAAAEQCSASQMARTLIADAVAARETNNKESQ